MVQAIPMMKCLNTDGTSIMTVYGIQDGQAFQLRTICGEIPRASADNRRSFSASRAYEANATVIGTVKSMANKAIDIESRNPADQ